MKQKLWFLIVLLVSISTNRPLQAQFRTLETDNLKLIYHDLSSDFLVQHMARSYTNSLLEYKKLLGYTPTDPVALFVHDGSDYGNAGADVLPRNRITMAMAPMSYWYETSPANERMNSTLHHEMVHIASNDAAIGRDVFFRKLFQGKVAISEDDPASIIYSYLTAPRRYAPRWYQEGIAVFMETWLSGQGRTLGGYDEMMFRTSVLAEKPFYDVVGLESEGTTVDFQVGVNSYLYGTRFVSYLALTYGPEKILSWFYRDEGSKAHFTSQFKVEFGLSLDEAWQNWISFEGEFQRANLARIRRFPITEHTPITTKSLGSMSRSFLDPATGKILAAVNYPGTLSHLASIDPVTGEIQKLKGIQGPSLFTVTSLAFDPDSRRLFYTSDNNRWRDIMQLDLETGKATMLQKNVRVGDLVFNPSDKSLWGVRHFLGLSTLVRIPAPYTDWDQVMTLPYGSDLYDLDISPDGKSLSAAKVSIDGSQRLVLYSTEKLMAGDVNFEVLFDFNASNPESFVFTPDGLSLIGSSYYSGVSNIYQVEISSKKIVALTNAETGYFRPQMMDSSRVLAFNFTADGFLPVLIANPAARQANNISFMGDEIVNKFPVVTEWLAPPPSRVNLDEIGFTDKPYNPNMGLSLASVYPVIQGYDNGVAVGLRFDLSDPLFLHEWAITASVSPDVNVPENERLHAALTYRYSGLTVSGAYNYADFYDLFGPTKRSRKGFAIRANYAKSIAWEGPKKNFGYSVGGAGFFKLQRLPDYQNVQASFTQLFTLKAGLNYKSVKSTIGAVDDESGVLASVNTSANLVNSEIFPRVQGEFQFGTLLPIDHLSLWLRTTAGWSAGDPSNAFANFYFGGFRNNWVDKEDEKQFRDALAFPGTAIDGISGTNFVKAQSELILPPIRFKNVGGSSLYLKWIRTTAFVSGIVTELDSPAVRQRAVSVGGQIDVRVMLFSYLRTTFSAGWARAKQIDGASSNETMISVKIL